MREEIRKQLRPVADKLVDRLTELVTSRVQATIANVVGQLNSAISAVASGDVPPPVAALPAPKRTPRAHRDPKPSKASMPGKTNGAAKARRAKDGRLITPPTCSKCGHTPGNARGCGRAHVTLKRAPADDATEEG